MNPYIHLNRLEYIVTYRCSSRCRHCYATGDKSGPDPIAADGAVHILNQLGSRYALDSVMTFGGEPLLYPEIVCAIHSAAKALQIPAREIITNGYWTTDTHKTRAIARSLASSGVNEVIISVDAFHQEYVPLERVKDSAQALLDAGIANIQWNPCWLGSEQDTNEYNLRTRAILDELQACLPIEAGSGNVMEPAGRAVDHFAAYFQRTYDWSTTSCQEMPYMDKLDDIRSLCVEPGGDIAICGVELGNAIRDDVNEILERYNPYEHAHMKLILLEGIEGLIREARSLGLELREDGYYSICDLCTSLRQEMAIAAQKEA